LTCVTLLPATGATATRTTASSMSTGSFRSSAAFAPTASSSAGSICARDGSTGSDSHDVLQSWLESQERALLAVEEALHERALLQEAPTVVLYIAAAWRRAQRRSNVKYNNTVALANPESYTRGHDSQSRPLPPLAASRLPHHSHQSVCQVFNKVRAERRDVIAVPTAQVRAVGYTEQVQ